MHHKLRLVTSLIGTAKSSSLATKTWLRVKPWRFPRRYWNYRVDCNIYILVGNVGVCQRTSSSVFGHADLTLRSLHMTFEWLFAAVFLHQHKFRTVECSDSRTVYHSLSLSLSLSLLKTHCINAVAAVRDFPFLRKLPPDDDANTIRWWCSDYWSLWFFIFLFLLKSWFFPSVDCKRFLIVQWWNNRL